MHVRIPLKQEPHHSTVTVQNRDSVATILSPVFKCLTMSTLPSISKVPELSAKNGKLTVDHPVFISLTYQDCTMLP